ncbi:hypothetical protein [Streptomyces sp. NPDC003697]
MIGKVPPEVGVLHLHFVELHLVGEEGGCLSDEHDDQRGAEHKGSPSFSRRFVFDAHFILHVA